MLQRQLKIVNKLGLHARASAKFVQCANQFQSDVQVCKESLTVNGKSIMGVLLLAAAQGSAIDVIVDGSDEAEAMAALALLVSERFGEE